MRINRIKVSGFKSFVDPITLTLPGNLTGVVGPNGCGKSNIIDALIWVMGESSAKHLRGDSMADVIFNGSNTRKPVGQATVEIVFDNTDGTIGGQYAGFGEISIKRSITRDATSSYFLNGTRCRRKDITNVFLGTGIGARGYSVIEQGMISRVIEARPEELRSFLEEAAGISKYKERRRETENRMRHTDENIERLNDIRDELEKQLNHLQRQARAAERYQVLKGEERDLEARLLATRWRAVDNERSGSRQLAEQRNNELEAEIARLREIEASQTGYREEQAEATEHFNAVQGEFYGHAGEISRLEQAIAHADERRQSVQETLESLRRTLTELDQSDNDSNARLATTGEEIAALEPRFATLQTSEKSAQDALGDVEQRFAAWQDEWDAFNDAHTRLSREEHGIRVRLEHLLEDVAGFDVRKTALDAEAGRNETGDLNARIAAERSELDALEQRRAQSEQQRQAMRSELLEKRRTAATLGAELHDTQTELEALSGRLASLRALQEAAYGEDTEDLDNWFRGQTFAAPERLAELVRIENGWEAALEAALRIPLGTWCGPQLVDGVLDAGSRPPAGRRLGALDLQAPRAAPGAQPAVPATLLLDKVSGDVDVSALLHGVYVADDLHGARTLITDLPPGSVVATRDGTLVGAGWVQLPDAGDARDGILSREQQISTLAATHAEQESAVAVAREELDRVRERVRVMEEEEHTLNEQGDRLGRDIAERRNALNQMEAEFQRRQARAADVREELERVAQQSSDNREVIERLQSESRAAAAALTKHESRREDLSARRVALERELDEQRQRWRAQRDDAHQAELRLQELRARRDSLNADRERARSDSANLNERIAAAERELRDGEAPRAQMNTDLEAALAARLDAENRLTIARQQLGRLDESMQDAQRRRADVEQTIQERQQRLEQVRLDQRALEVRLQELAERFAQVGDDLEACVNALTDDDTEQSVGEALEKLANRIARLGPINLAAIDEYEQLSERKTYLDQQHTDLIDALNTLQDAIRKIDKETRTRFKETYDKVNNGLQAMFPVLFGGGHAYLELTGDDLLETGVTVMARPPGKRNSTIHLLSGGEKALTALAFVFSIFELNPAPFCLLDEVDAPLDDANVVRLTDMLKSMSNNVQFLFITHNKITMEIAEQLVGVTMQEAGVSRLVSVNMEEAVELAATA